MIGSILSALLIACGRKTSFSAEMIQPFESKLGFPLVQVRGVHVLEAWEHLSKNKAVSPVVIGDPESLLYISEGLEYADSETVEDVLLKAERLEFPSGLKAMRSVELKELLELGKNDSNFKELFAGLEADQEISISTEDVLSDWPRGRANKSKITLPSVAIDWSSETPLETVIIALIPTSDWTEVPAYMRFGGYNDCPASEWHVAALRYFRDLNNVRLVGISHDTIDLKAMRPPQSRGAAAQLAIDLYEYCPDLVDQGSGSIGELARDSMTTSLWSLWWD